MKVIKVPMNDDLLRPLSRQVKTRKLTRSALICEACQHHLEKLREDDLDRQYVAGYRRHPESAAVGRAGERLAGEVWPREDWS
jgi:metal-responsive CopG/Arc/MetJ family transcriptional regulator